MRVCTKSQFIDSPVTYTFKLKKTNTVVLPDTKAYPVGKVPIKKEKLQDLQKVIHYIPDEHRPFFQERLSWPTKTTAVANEDD